jgi:hypothetical protein
MKKITAILHNGLGNMLFQIAAAYAYSLDHGHEFKLYDNLYIPCHHPQLESYKDNIFSNIEILKTNEEFYRYDELSFCYNKIPKFDANFVLFGYFQSEKYFVKYKEQIQKIFDFNSKIIQKYSNELKQKNCSIHVRRGDYLNLQNNHPIQNLEYYKKAVSFFDNDTNFLIFSNDIEWCKNNLNKETIGSNNLIFIEDDEPQDELLLMSKCNSNIIANSTFSWWGAWLNKNVNKKIIVPSNWLTKEYGELINFKYEDLIPNEWINI